MGEKLTFDSRQEHLKENTQLNQNWKKITKKDSEKIFNILNQRYNTNFELRKRDSYFEEKYRFYYDTKFYYALKNIKELLNKKTLQYKTIDKIINFVKEIEILQEALNTKKPASSTQSLLYPTIRWEDGQGKIDFFPELSNRESINATPWREKDTKEEEPIENEEPRSRTYKYDNY